MGPPQIELPRRSALLKRGLKTNPSDAFILQAGQAGAGFLRSENNIDRPKHMKTPTLIIRLIGIYLIVTSITTMLQYKKMQGITSGFLPLQIQISGDVWTYVIVYLVVGLAATAFAGFIARILTFDAGRD